MFNLKSLFVAATAFAVTAVIAMPLAAQDWPTRPITIVVTTGAGGQPDTTARLIAPKLQAILGQPVLVENTPGSQGVVGNLKVLRAKPDGYVMVMFTGGAPIQAAIRKSVPYDLSKDFEMVGMFNRYPLIMSVRPDSKLMSVSDVIAAAKKGKGAITHTMTSVGSGYHMLGEWINMDAKVEMQGVSYRGAPPAFLDLAAGRVDVMFDAPAFSMGQIKAGKLRPIAVSGPEAFGLLPGVPTIASTVPGVTMESFNGLAMPTGTPKAIVNKVSAALRDIVAMPDIRARLTELGNIPSYKNPEEMRAQIVSMINNFRRIAVAKGISK